MEYTSRQIAKVILHHVGYTDACDDFFQLKYPGEVRKDLAALLKKIRSGDSNWENLSWNFFCKWYNEKNNYGQEFQTRFRNIKNGVEEHCLSCKLYPDRKYKA